MRRLILALVLLAAAVPAQAQRSLAERIEDLRRSAAVRTALAQDTETRPYDVDVRAEAGVVTLAGTVPTRGVRERMEAVARGVAGVVSVVNDLRLDGQPGVPVAERPAVREAGAGPPAEASAEDAQPVYHTVQRDDTLYSIARRYGTTVEALQRLNGMGGSTILRLGQRLRIR